MPRPHKIPISIPVRPSSAFIAFSVGCAFIFNLLPWPAWISMPDGIALVLVFWNIHQPHKIGMGAAFLLGILMDVSHTSLLGEYALTYIILVYGAMTIYRRVLWSSLFMQSFLVLPLFLIAKVIPFIVHLIVAVPVPSWQPIIQTFIETALWPLISIIFLAPQKHANNTNNTTSI